MSEQEFDLYLKLLAKCLRLTSGQRELIADELRDHLEERLEELRGPASPASGPLLKLSTNSATRPFWPLTSPRSPV